MKLNSFLSIIALAVLGHASLLAGPVGRPTLHGSAPIPVPGVKFATVPTTLDLTAFGAIGDGVADDGPALQRALDAIAAAGGGTLFVPAGRYAIYTPVQKNFTGLATSVTIQGVESSTPVPPPTSGGRVLTRGLDLVSEFAPRTGQSQNAVTITGLETFLVKDLVFIGTPDVSNDALVTLSLSDISDATIYHCEFYGLSSLVSGGAIVQAVRSSLTFEQSVVLGSTCSSGVYSSVIENLEWKGITVSEAIFADYGQRPELYGKMTTAPYSWVGIGNAAAKTNDSPRREVVLRSVFLDEGGYVGISSLPYRYSPPSAPIDLLYVTGLFMNVSNLGTTGHYLSTLENLLIEKSHYGWSSNTQSAIEILSVGQTILDEVECVAGANRIHADAQSGKLTVINSVYTHLDSQAQTTNVITTATPEEDPVQHVRLRFQEILGRAPDAAAHFYWSDQILQCAGAAVCIADEQAALISYLQSSPSEKFAITGKISNESGDGVAGVIVALSGAQSTAATTDSAGNYRFANLPTSGTYTVTPSLQYHTLTPINRTIVTPSGDQVFDSVATLNHHTISGRIADSSGAAINGVTVTLSGSQEASVNSGVDGTYSFANLPAGGTYAVGFRKTSYSFAPQSQTFSGLAANQTLNVTGTFVKYSIAGIIVSANNSPLEGVTISLSGSQNGTTTSDSTGTFTFNGLPSEGNYTVTPAIIGYTFGPASRTYTNLAANQYHNYLATYTTRSISGRVTDATSGAGLSGATVAVSGHQSRTVSTDATGNYSFSLEYAGSYTLTASKTHYTVANPTQSFSNLVSNQTVNFAATLLRHNVSGRATSSNGSAIAGATIRISGTQTLTTTTDENGSYSFPSLPAGGNYTVTPSKTSYSWAPQAQTFSDLGSDRTGNFTGTLVSYTVSGQVLENGVGLSGVSIALGGAQTSAILTDSSGNYSFTLPSESNYTVTPSKQHYTFTPVSLNYNNLSGPQTGNFTATRNRYAVTGRVLESGAGLSGVSIALTGSQSSTVTTDSSGNYSFTLTAEGNYTLTASKQHYTFAPLSLNYNNLTGPQTGSFTATRNRYTVGGRVLEKGAGLSGVSIALTGSQTSTVTTDSSGSYSFTVPSEGNYTVTPSKLNYTFAPVRTTYNSLSAPQTGNFTATRDPHTISGRILNINNTGMAGITVALSGGQAATTTTDAAGNFSFANLVAGTSYTVTPSLLYHSFTPANRTYANLATDQQGAFVGTLNSHSISGQIADAAGHSVGGVTVALTGPLGPIQTTTSGADGNYSFGSLAAGISYLVAVSKPKYFFEPPSRSFVLLSSNATGNFTARLEPIIEFRESSYNVSESIGTLTLTVTRGGETSGETSVIYSATDGTAHQGDDLNSIIGQVHFAPGETSQTFSIFITNDAFVEGTEELTVRLSDPQGAILDTRSLATITISDDDTDTGTANPNPVDDAQFFVRQHYRDFLNREPDAAGLGFWSDQIVSCGTNASCVEDRRINVSAAFFLSIEFQETGFLVYRLYKAAYALAPRHLEEFLLDTRAISRNVMVNAPGWQQQLEENKAAFLTEFVARSDFIHQYPINLTPSEFVQRLNGNAAVPLTAEGLAAAVAEFNGATNSADPAARGRVLRRTVESETFKNRELSPAFVLMQYFGYLQRNPNDPPDDDLDGYNFWLAKLNEFGGDFHKAQMVRSFLVSIEYRSRFGL